jgi:diguanylate cyclase (GGDEF)-like protein
MEPKLDHARSWLCPEPGDRERLLDMDRRLRRARTGAMAFLGVAVFVCGPWVGWETVPVLLLLALAWRVLARRVPHSKKPEWPLAAGWVLSCVAIGVGVLMTGDADSPAKSWMLVPAVALPARFHRRGLYAGMVVCLGVLAIVTIGVDPQHVRHAPQEFIFPAALILASVALSMALRDAELQHRNEAVIDQLTGMLNRKALESRGAELEIQSQVTGQPVGLIVCDIDNFKHVNDGHGHTTGDVVLKNVAYRIRKELRAYDLAYRLGGEEFVVLVPGASLAATRDLAERLRVAIESAPIENIDVTASFGVAASGEHAVSCPRLFDEADEALYRAKASGRNRVCSSDSSPLAPIA